MTLPACRRDAVRALKRSLESFETKRRTLPCLNFKRKRVSCLRRSIPCTAQEITFEWSIELYKTMKNELHWFDMTLILRIIDMWTREKITTLSAEYYIRNILRNHPAMLNDWNFFTALTLDVDFELNSELHTE